MVIPQVLAWSTDKGPPVLIFSAGCYCSPQGTPIWKPQFYENHDFKQE